MARKKGSPIEEAVGKGQGDDRYKKPLDARAQKQWLMGPVWGVEQKFWERLRKDFKTEIACINRGLAVLRKVDDDITKEIFKRDVDVNEVIGTLDDLKKQRGQVSREDIFLELLLDPQELSRAVCAFLCSEALERLIAARLLIFTGHISRALSCIRDAYECLRCSDVCRASDTESRRWLKGRKVKVPQGFVLTALLAQDSMDHKLFNKWGTHAYYESVIMSAVLGPFCPQLETMEETERIYTENSSACIGFILFAIRDMLGYLVIIHQKSIETTPEIVQVYESISRNLDRVNERFSRL